MKINVFIKLAIVLTLVSFTTKLNDSDKPPLRESFVYLKELIPDLRSDMRYYGSNNFIGRPVNGYSMPRLILTKEAGEALKRVHDGLSRLGFGLMIYDAYRPQRAVNDFVQWAKNEEDTLMKEKYYPNIDKKDLFELGYIAEKSGHSRGSTIDLTIVSLTTGKILNMGSDYDLFDEKSHTDHQFITKNQRALRLLLKRRMEKEGFKSYEKEWWHFTLKDEPYPDTILIFQLNKS